MDSFDFFFLCLPLPTSYFYSKPVFNAYCHPPASSAGSLSRGTEPFTQASFLTLRHGPAGLFEHHLKVPLAHNGWWHLHRQECSLSLGLNFWFSWTLGLSLVSQKGTPPTISPPRLWIYFHIHLFSRLPWWNSFKISLEGFPLRKSKCPLGWAGWREDMMMAADSLTWSLPWERDRKDESIFYNVQCFHLSPLHGRKRNRLFATRCFLGPTNPSLVLESSVLWHTTSQLIRPGFSIDPLEGTGPVLRSLHKLVAFSDEPLLY